MSEGIRARAAVAHERAAPLQIEEALVREPLEGEVLVRIAGAARIIAVDPNGQRLELAGRLGATDLVSPADADPVAAVHAATEGGVDLAVEAVGSATVARQAFDSLAPGGRAVVVGLTGFAEEIRVPMVSLLLDKALRGSIYGSADPAPTTRSKR